MNDEKNGALHAQYKALAEKEPKVVFGGRLIDCRLETNHIPYAEMPVVFTEKQHWPG